MKRFEVWLPRHEYWVFEVEAETAEEAVEIAEAGGNVEQVFTMSCAPGAVKPKVIVKKPRTDK